MSFKSIHGIRENQWIFDCYLSNLFLSAVVFYIEKAIGFSSLGHAYLILDILLTLFFAFLLTGCWYKSVNTDLFIGASLLNISLLFGSLGLDQVYQIYSVCFFTIKICYFTTCVIILLVSILRFRRKSRKDICNIRENSELPTIAIFIIIVLVSVGGVLARRYLFMTILLFGISFVLLIGIKFILKWVYEPSQVWWKYVHRMK